MTWRVVSSCRQATWPFSCDYHNFSASNVQCPRTAELGIMSCKWNYSVNHGRAWGLSWWKHIIARLCLSRICSLNLPTMRHSRDKCYVTALPCGSSAYAFPRCYLITSQANIPYYHHPPLHLPGCIWNADNRGEGEGGGVITLNCTYLWILESQSYLILMECTLLLEELCLKSFAEHPNRPISNYVSLGHETGDCSHLQRPSQE